MGGAKVWGAGATPSPRIVIGWALEQLVTTVEFPPGKRPKCFLSPRTSNTDFIYLFLSKEPYTQKEMDNFIIHRENCSIFCLGSVEYSIDLGIYRLAISKPTTL